MADVNATAHVFREKQGLAQLAESNDDYTKHLDSLSTSLNIDLSISNSNASTVVKVTYSESTQCPSTLSGVPVYTDTYDTITGDNVDALVDRIVHATDPGNILLRKVLMKFRHPIHQHLLSMPHTYYQICRALDYSRNTLGF